MNVTQLDAELRAAGVLIDGVDSFGNVSFKAEATAAQKTQAAQVVASHVDGPTTPAAVSAVVGVTDDKVTLQQLVSVLRAKGVIPT